MRHKKAMDVGMGVIVLVVIILAFFIFLVQMGQRECSTNADCGDNQYCGADFACHAHPVQKVTETVVEKQGNYLVPAIIVGIAIVIGAFVLRGGGFSVQRTRKPRASQAKEHTLDSSSLENYGEDDDIPGNDHQHKHH